MIDYAAQIAHNSLAVGSIRLRPSAPFQWASGFYMPIYNDNRMNLYNPTNRDLVVEAFVDALDSTDKSWGVMAGTSTAGIPWAAMLAERYGKPLIYVRDKPKDHGMRNRIEGIDAEKGLEDRRVVLIEDLVSTGGSSVSAVQGIRDAGGQIGNCFSIFSYGLDEAQRMFDAKTPYDPKTGASLTALCMLKPLLTYETLLAVAREEGYIDAAQAKLLEEWRANPFEWGEKHGFPPVKK